MNLADVFTVTFLILGLVTILTAYWLLAAGLFPAATERAAERLARGPVRFPLLGLAIWLPLMLFGFKLLKEGSNGALKAAAVVLLLLPLLAALFGSAGLPALIGRGLRAARDEADPWRRQLRGSLVLAFCAMLPLLGWFLVLPYVLAAGFGLWVAAVFTRAARPALAPAPAPVLPATEPSLP